MAHAPKPTKSGRELTAWNKHHAKTKQKGEGSISKWFRKRKEAKNRNQLKRHTARLEELRKIENPNDWQKNQIRNAVSIINESKTKSNKKGMQDDQGDKGKGPKSNPVGSKVNKETWPKKQKTTESDYKPGDLTKNPKKAYYSPSLGRMVTGAGIKAQAAEDRKKMLAKKSGKATKKSGKATNKEKVKVEKKPEKKDDGGRAEWLKKTRNSPAAKSGVFSDDERWALQQKHRKWKASRGKK